MSSNALLLQPPTILSNHTSVSCLLATSCPEAPLLLDYIRTQAAGSEGLTVQEVTPINGASPGFSPLVNINKQALYNSIGAVRVTCTLTASFPGSSTLHPLCRGFDAKSIKTANTALPPPPRPVLVRHSAVGGGMNAAMRGTEIQSD